MAYNVGDIIFWSIDRTAGEAMVIGHAKDAGALIITIGSQFTEVTEGNGTPTGCGWPPVGASYRREYMKRFPGKLKPCSAGQLPSYLADAHLSASILATHLAALRDVALRLCETLAMAQSDGS
jgi:hypothetical protein